MKLRIRGNSLRLRLLQSEVADLRNSSRVAERISFGPETDQSITYAVQVSENATAVSAGFCENEICVILPADDATEWIDSDQTGIASSLEMEGGTLEILVEKDFVCLTRTDDPDSKDAYPNPEADC